MVINGLLLVIDSPWIDANAARDKAGLTFVTIPPHWFDKIELSSRLQLNSNSPKELFIVPTVVKYEAVELLVDDIVVDFGTSVSFIVSVVTKNITNSY
jgi:hypothetical protein